MTSHQIADQAATYLLDYVGDAVAAGSPHWSGDYWQVPVVLSYREKQLGVLRYSSRGQLIREESDSPQVLRERSRER